MMSILAFCHTFVAFVVSITNYNFFLQAYSFEDIVDIIQMRRKEKFCLRIEPTFY